MCFTDGSLTLVSGRHAGTRADGRMYALEHIVACTYSVHVVTGSKRTCSCATCAQGGDCNSRPRFQSQKSHAVGPGTFHWRTLRILGLSRCEMHCTLTVSRPCKESISNVLRLPTALMPSWPKLQPCATAEEFSSRVKTRIDPGSGTHPSFKASRIFALSGSLLITVPLVAIAPSVQQLRPPWTVFLA